MLPTGPLNAPLEARMAKELVEAVMYVPRQKQPRVGKPLCVVQNGAKVVRPVDEGPGKLGFRQLGRVLM